MSFTDCKRCGRRVQVSLTRAERKTIGRMYFDNRPLKQIAWEFNITVQGVNAVRQQLGIPANRRSKVRS